MDLLTRRRWRTRVYSGHQPVGNNILDGVPAVFDVAAVESTGPDDSRAWLAAVATASPR